MSDLFRRKTPPRKIGAKSAARFGRRHRTGHLTAVILSSLEQKRIQHSIAFRFTAFLKFALAGGSQSQVFGSSNTTGRNARRRCQFGWSHGHRLLHESISLLRPTSARLQSPNDSVLWDLVPGDSVAIDPGCNTKIAIIGNFVARFLVAPKGIYPMIRMQLRQKVQDGTNSKRQTPTPILHPLLSDEGVIAPDQCRKLGSSFVPRCGGPD